MNFRTISDLNNIINKNLHKIPKDIDLIVGVPRSGMLVANIISLYLNLPLTDIDSLVEGKIFKCGNTKKKKWISNVNEARKILIIEDSSNSGNSLYEVKEKIKNSLLEEKIMFLTIYVTEFSKNLTDIYFEVIENPRMFEWNYLHHPSLEKVCFDIDGVLCLDPTEEENDDGEKYRKFIRNAPLRVTPTFKIGTLITARLEKYREDTEFWLKKNNIKYNKLIMMNFQTKEERIKSGSYGKFKGENYKKIKSSNLFIESDPTQAREIAKISGKAVFCTENQKFYTQNTINRIKNKTKSRIKKIVVKFLPNKIKNLIKRNMELLRK